MPRSRIDPIDLSRRLVDRRHRRATLREADLNVI
jgi:hypothetical protein